MDKPPLKSKQVTRRNGTRSGKDGTARAFALRRSSYSTAHAPLTEVALDLENSIVVLLTMLANQISTSGSVTFQARHGLSSPEWKALAVIAAIPGSSGADIAQVLSIDKASISRTVKALSQRNLVEIARNTGKGNHQAITLSQHGRDLHTRALVTAVEREQCMVAVLTADERESMRRCLRAMMDRMPSVAKLATVPAGQMFDAADRTMLTFERKSRAEAIDEDGLRDRINRLESLLADLMLENAALRERGASAE